MYEVIDNLHLFTSLLSLPPPHSFDIQGTEDTSLSTSTIEYYQQEMATLKKANDYHYDITLSPPHPSPPPPPSQLLADERKKNETVTYTYQHTCAKLDNKEKELLELRSKYDEMMSILERERTESEQKERRISQLEKSQKVQYKCTVCVYMYIQLVHDV